MTFFRDLTDKAPSSEALIKIYKTTVVINAAAGALLGLDSGARVTFSTVGPDSPMGPARVYIGTRKCLAHKVTRVGHRYRINSTDLAKKLAQLLQGPGTYRVAAEDSQKDYEGNVYYKIFYRKYK